MTEANEPIVDSWEFQRPLPFHDGFFRLTKSESQEEKGSTTKYKQSDHQRKNRPRCCTWWRKRLSWPFWPCWLQPLLQLSPISPVVRETPVVLGKIVTTTPATGFLFLHSTTQPRTTTSVPTDSPPPVDPASTFAKAKAMIAWLASIRDATWKVIRASHPVTVWIHSATVHVGTRDNPWTNFVWPNERICLTENCVVPAGVANSARAWENRWAISPVHGMPTRACVALVDVSLGLVVRMMPVNAVLELCEVEATTEMSCPCFKIGYPNYIYEEERGRSLSSTLHVAKKKQNRPLPCVVWSLHCE